MRKHVTAYKTSVLVVSSGITVLLIRNQIMSNNVKSFSVGYNPINESNIFTSGDCITGQITFELAKDCKIDALCVKLKGKAEVTWSENNGKSTRTYHSKEKYFSLKQVIIEAGLGK